MRPIVHKTEKWQQMLTEVRELAKMADDYGFEAICFPEHHLHAEGMEQGGPHSLYLDVPHHTKNIKVGPVGYVLPSHNPVKLAIETAWLDQMTKGRTVVGFARGYQERWFNAMTQLLPVQTATSDASERDKLNRELFEEVYRILKLAWKEESFSYEGKFYSFPYPPGGTNWPAADYIRRFGADGEIGDDGLLHKISVVPKPYQKPHPKLFQAFSMSENTIRWTAREGITPIILTSIPEDYHKMVEAYQDEAKQHLGLDLALGKNTGVLRSVHFGRNKDEAMRQAQRGVSGMGWENFWGHHGFYEVFRKAGETGPVPQTVERMEESHYLYAGDVGHVTEKMHELWENGSPEYFVWWSDQGSCPSTRSGATFSCSARRSCRSSPADPDTLGMGGWSRANGTTHLPVPTERVVDDPSPMTKGSPDGVGSTDPGPARGDAGPGHEVVRADERVRGARRGHGVPRPAGRAGRRRGRARPDHPRRGR
ncbi:LLM class flavin-dependent oxidoreductase [Pseudonocardia oceani]|uniref:LLM class flavin-dependent oxidoreductase n=1 Tax=Pseudonocardia oceani TaxID=2792013 RepID=UPI001CF7D4A7|nr:LLM class flavin-dependent oxidoreductase [Pseudonocardia oceani]